MKEQTDRSMEQTESPEIYSYKYSQLIFNEGTITIQGIKGSLFNNSARPTRYPHTKNMNLDTDFMPLSQKKDQLRMDSKLNGKWKTIRLSEDNTEEILNIWLWVW